MSDPVTDPAADLTIRPLMTIDIEGSEPLELGETPFGRRRIVPVRGGVFSGSRLSGRVLDAGGDWALVRADRSFVPDVRLVLQTEDGELISFTYQGRWVARPEDMEKLLRREGDLTAISHYWRTLCTFECASDGRHAWLNHIVAVARGTPKVGGVSYEVFEIR